MKRSLARPLVILACLWLAAFVPAQAVSFRISQMGYHPQGSKVVVMEDLPEETPVTPVLFAPDRRNPKIPLLLGATVFEDLDVKVYRDKHQTGPAVKTVVVDFSGYQVPGTYEIRLEGTEIKSPPLKITDFVFWDTLKALTRSFYFQRCGQEVEDKELRLYHAACHLDDAEAAENVKVQTLLGDGYKDVVGGWHNGGDYAKYATSNSMAAARLMAMVEWGPKPYKYLRLDYPLTEPNLGDMQDIHHEIKAGLDWLLLMQRADGAVYRKVAGKQWPGAVRPEDDQQKRYLYGISTHDTANMAAAMAMATRVFKTEDLGYSVKTLLAAEKAWKFLEQHPQPFVERSESDYAGSGEFLDPRYPSDLPNRVWAAAELYLATGNEKYHQYFLTHLQQVPVEPFTWRNPAFQGVVDYLFYAAKPNEKMAASLKHHVQVLANRIEEDIRQGIFPSGLDRYGRGSNHAVAERAAVLVAAHRIKANPDYLQAASRSVNYLLGVNPFGISYVVGAGDQSVQNLAHRWMQASAKRAPGFLVGGPDEAAPESIVPKNIGPRSYVDKAEAASVNESTVLYNASLAYLMGILNAAYNVGHEAPETGRPDADPRELF